MNCQPASIQLNNLSWSPHPNKPLLKPISVSIPAGEFLAIVGPNGSGKTSLLRCLYRVNKPSSGQVLIDDVDIWSLTPRQCAKRIATVLQGSDTPFDVSVFEMVEIGLTPKSINWQRSNDDIKSVNQALEMLNLTHIAERSCNDLSGGERQRVMIARALVQKPDVLILDEPTNHLDIRHQLDMLEILAKLPCTIIVSLHDLSLASAYADKILVLKNGEMVAYEHPDKALTAQRIKQVFEVQTHIDKHPITQQTQLSFYIND